MTNLDYLKYEEDEVELLRLTNDINIIDAREASDYASHMINRRILFSGTIESIASKFILADEENGNIHYYSKLPGIEVVSNLYFDSSKYAEPSEEIRDNVVKYLQTEHMDLFLTKSPNFFQKK